MHARFFFREVCVLVSLPYQTGPSCLCRTLSKAGGDWLMRSDGAATATGHTCCEGRAAVARARTVISPGCGSAWAFLATRSILGLLGSVNVARTRLRLVASNLASESRAEGPARPCSILFFFFSKDHAQLSEKRACSILFLSTRVLRILSASQKVYNFSFIVFS